MDTSQISNSGVGYSTLYDKLTKITVEFAKRLIQVVPLTTNNIKPSNSICFRATPLAADYTSGIPDSDFHIYAQAINDMTTPFRNQWYSSTCVVGSLGSSYPGPRFGNLVFNKYHPSLGSSAWVTNPNQNLF